MNDFTASNGIIVCPQTQGGIYIRDDCRADEDRAQALREFFQAEADERLGRWRWPENPEYVAIPRERTDTPREKRRVRVIHEPSGDFMDTVEGSSLVGVFKDAARAYFNAHPEPKPWHDAKPGEVWELTVDDEKDAPLWIAKRVGHVYFKRLDGAETQMTYGRRSAAITAGRRIWPEVAS